MSSTEYKKKDLLKFQPFYTTEIKKNKRKKRKTKKSIKNPKKLSNKELSQALPYYPKKSKKPKRLTKRQTLQNILPFPETVGISRRERAFKGSGETYVEVIDNKSLGDSLFLAKRSIIDFLKDLLEEKRGFKYSLLAIVTFKKME